MNPVEKISVAGDTRTRRIGIAGGTITSIAGFLGYFLIPIVTGGYYFLEMGYYAFVAVLKSVHSDRGLVVVIPSFLGMFVGTSLLRKSGESSKKDELLLFGWNIVLPLLTAVGLYILGALLPWGVLVQHPSEISGGIVLFLLFYTAMSFVIGGVFAAFAIVCVLGEVLVGSVSGYVLAVAVSRGWRRLG